MGKAIREIIQFQYLNLANSQSTTQKIRLRSSFRRTAFFSKLLEKKMKKAKDKLEKADELIRQAEYGISK